MKTEVYAEFELLTPERAEKLLANKARNRNCSDKRVRMLISDIQSDNWKITGDTIRLNSKGQLMDGQHRCSAVVATGKPVYTLVAYNIPEDGMLAIDTGMKRTPADRMNITFGTTYPRRVFSMVYAMRDYPETGSAGSDLENYAFIKQHHETIMFAYDKISKIKNRCNNVHVGAVIARAAYHYSEDVLEGFAHILATGMAKEDGDRAVILFRDWLIGLADINSRALRKEVQLRCARALKAYKDREPLKKLYRAPIEFFPLP